MHAKWMTGIAVVLWMAASCVAQKPLPGDGDFHGAHSAIAVSRSEFGSECGIQDTSDPAAAEFSRSPEGEWSAASSSTGGEVVETARLWHETNYMLDLHGVLGSGMSSMHSGLMCFDAQGQLTRAFDRYMDALRCGCQRLTTITYAADGTLTGWEQKFVDLRTRDLVKPPADTKDFPDVWEFHRMDQLPFYSLLKLKQGAVDRPTE